MTIKDMRRAMRDKVVPEEIVPQNVVNMLIDEDAELPKMNAFMFLTRLRALGVGSSDFLNLLEGCGAPEEVVDKIKQNPRMNLQGLILTLESANLTSDDYSSMLLTARQVWERTLTLRLENAKKAAEKIEEEDDEDDVKPEKPAKSAKQAKSKSAKPAKQAKSAKPVEPAQSVEPAQPAESVEPAEPTATEENTPEAGVAEAPAQQDAEESSAASLEPTPEEMEGEDYDKELHEMSFTEVLNLINKDINALENRNAAPPKSAPAQDEEEEDVEELSFEAAFDKIKMERAKFLGSETRQQEESGEMIPPAPPAQPAPFAPTAAQTGGENIAAPSGNNVFTGMQRANIPIVTDGDEEDYDDEDEDDEDVGLSKTRSYNTGAIVGGIVGALLLAGSGFVVSRIIANKEQAPQAVSFASSANEIFQKIYYAYNDNVTGGKLATEIDDPGVMFGDLLVSGDEEKILGSYTMGSGVYSVTDKAVSVTAPDNGALSDIPDIPAPNDAHFVAVVDENDALYAIFSGKSSGYMKITESGALYEVSQDGFLTDYEVTEGIVKLATVYTPVFGHDFEVSEEDVYLPHAGPGSPKLIAADKILVSDTKGYSYGISANYIKINGNLSSAVAVIGDPVAAGTDGRFAVSDAQGMLIKTDGSAITTKATKKMDRAAFYSGGCAVCEAKPDAEDSKNKDDSVWGDIKLFDTEYKPVSIIRGYNVPPRKMWFGGNTLSAVGGYGELVLIDCSDGSAPKPLSFRQTTGAVINNSAVIFSAEDDGITLTRYDLANGSPVKLTEYKKALTADSAAGAKLGAVRAALVEGTATGAAYTWFDGVSVVWEYVVFEADKNPRTATVFDDKTGFIAAFSDNGIIKAVCADGLKVPQ